MQSNCNTRAYVCFIIDYIVAGRSERVQKYLKNNASIDEKRYNAIDALSLNRHCIEKIAAELKSMYLNPF